jgi:hypothetical protein
LKDLAFALAVPADPAFRPLVSEVAGKYGESLGLPEPEARALAASAGEAVDLAAGTGPGAEITIEVHREGDQLELTVSGGGTSSTMSRSLAGANST